MFVNLELISYNLGIGALRSPKNKPATLTGRGLFRVLEVAMQPANQPTKADERARLRELAEQRQSETPEHQDPDWMAAFWLRKAVLS